MPELVPLMKLEDMTPAEARVVVAKDVLAELDAKTMRGERGVYVDLFNGIRDLELIGADLREYIGLKPCRVCAVGAAAVAFVRRFDGVKIDGTEDDDGDTIAETPEAHEVANAIFPEHMRALMESAFEVDTWFAKSATGDAELAGRAADFGCDFGEGEEDAALRAIFQNIIDNGGEFRP